jgi:succinoglycan biosynthesis transport protein ExoP
LDSHRASTAIAVTQSEKLDAKAVETLARQLHEDLTGNAKLGVLISELKLTPSALGISQTPSAYELISELLGFTDTKINNSSELMIGTLRERITFEALENKPTQIAITVDAPSAALAARIVNGLSLRTMTEIGQFTPGGVDLELNEARNALDKIEAELTGFQLRYSDDEIAQMAQMRQDYAQAQNLVSISRSELSSAQSSSQMLQSMKGPEALNAILPDDLGFDALRDLQQRYAAAKGAVGMLSADYGAKHPKLLAAKSNLDGVAAEAAKTLARSRTEAKQLEAAAVERLAAAEQQLTTLDERLAKLGKAPDELELLEKRLETARARYLSLAELSPVYAKQEMLTAQMVARSERVVPVYDWSLLSLYSLFSGFSFAAMGLWFGRRFNRTEKTVAKVQPVSPLRPQPIKHSAKQPAISQPVQATERVRAASAEPRVIAPVEPVIQPVPNRSYGLVQDNDTPLDIKVKQLLMRNASSADDAAMAKLPPLVRAAVEGKITFTQAEIRELDAIKHELEHLRREMEKPRARVSPRSNRI